MPLSVQPTYNIVQGEDAMVSVLIISNNEAPDLSTCADIYAAVRSGNNSPSIVFALNPNDTTVNQLEIDTAQNNVLKLPFKREHTKDLPMGTLFCDIILKFDDMDFPDGKHDEISGIRIGTVREGKLKDIII